MSARVIQQQAGLTNVKLRKAPIAPNKRPACGLLFLLTQAKVNLVLIGWHVVSREVELQLVPVALVLAIHEHEDGESRCDVAITLHSNTEWDLRLWYGNEAFDTPVAIACAILFERRVALTQLDGASDLLELGHLGVGS